MTTTISAADLFQALEQTRLAVTTSCGFKFSPQAATSPDQALRFIQAAATIAIIERLEGIESLAEQALDALGIVKLS